MARMGEGSTQGLGGEGGIKGKRKLVRPRRRREKKIDMGLQVIGWEGHRLELFG